MKVVRCPRCLTNGKATARFCGSCGLRLSGVAAERAAGRVPHPSPAAAPEGWTAVDDAVDLRYTWESAWGGRAAGIEGFAVLLHNAGYPLGSVVLQLTGRDAEGKERLVLERVVAALPRDRTARIEVSSFELTAAIASLSIRLVTAEFGPE